MHAFAMFIEPELVAMQCRSLCMHAAKGATPEKPPLPVCHHDRPLHAQANAEAYRMCLEGVKLLSSWSAAVLDAHAWKSVRGAPSVPSTGKGTKHAAR